MTTSDFVDDATRITMYVWLCVLILFAAAAAAAVCFMSSNVFRLVGWLVGA